MSDESALDPQPRVCYLFAAVVRHLAIPIPVLALLEETLEFVLAGLVHVAWGWLLGLELGAAGFGGGHLFEGRGVRMDVKTGDGYVILGLLNAAAIVVLLGGALRLG